MAQQLYIIKSSTAHAHDRDANDLFAEVWNYYKQNHG